MEVNCWSYPLLALTVILCLFPKVNAFEKEVDRNERFIADYIAKPLIDSRDIEAGINIGIKETAAKVKGQYSTTSSSTASSVTTNHVEISKIAPRSVETTKVTTTSTTTKPVNNSKTNAAAKSATVPTTPVPTTTAHPAVRRQLQEKDANKSSTTNAPERASSSGSPDTTVSATSEIIISSTTEEVEATTEEPKSSPTPAPAYEFGTSTKEFFCLCDYQVKKCDMNCCCDPDCDEKEKRLFAHCAETSLIYDPMNHRNKDHSCFKSYIMYRENIPYKVDRTDKNLFCVVKDNVRQQAELSQAEIDEVSRRVSHGKIKKTPKYTWDTFHATQHHQFFISEPYKYGDAIWVAHNDDPNRPIDMLRLPTRYHTDLCSLMEPVKYLQDSVSSCVRHLGNLKLECETRKDLDVNSLIKDISVITNPAKSEDNTSDIIPAYLCRNNLQNCEEFSMDSGSEEMFPSPKLTGFILSDHCTNVLTQLNLTLVHDGLEGVVKVFAKALFTDVTIEETHIVQEFRTEFVWSNARTSKTVLKDGLPEPSNETSIEDVLYLHKLPRSGNPGYVVGNPLILGRKVLMIVQSGNQTESEKKYVEKMQVIPDDSQWLLTQGFGYCPKNHTELQAQQRNEISFGYDQILSCSLELDSFSDCYQLQKHIISIIFGREDVDNTHYVAAYGSPDAFPGDWVKINYDEVQPMIHSSPPGMSPTSKGCRGIINAIHITITFAHVGPVDSPQAKITGILFQPEEAINIPEMSTKVPLKHLPVTTTVTFLDVTGRPTTRVATFPVVSVQLPADFFYPFSSSKKDPSSGASRYEHDRTFFLVPSIISWILLVGGTFIL